jgi:hypothetical protein
VQPPVRAERARPTAEPRRGVLLVDVVLRRILVEHGLRQVDHPLNPGGLLAEDGTMALETARVLGTSQDVLQSCTVSPGEELVAGRVRTVRRGTERDLEGVLPAHHDGIDLDRGRPVLYEAGAVISDRRGTDKVRTTGDEAEGESSGETTSERSHMLLLL